MYVYIYILTISPKYPAMKGSLIMSFPVPGIPTAKNPQFILGIGDISCFNNVKYKKQNSSSFNRTKVYQEKHLKKEKCKHSICENTKLALRNACSLSKSRFCSPRSGASVSFSAHRDHSACSSLRAKKHADRVAGSLGTQRTP